MASNNEKTLNTIKMLGIDMIQNAGSGHPGITLGASAIMYSLYLNSLNVKSDKPSWINRDRFILSCGHASSLLYATLHFAGFDISLDDLRRYRQIDSFTPGHPEYNPNLGVECTTGALGQGIGAAVGIALGERYLENLCKSYNPKSKLIDYYTYVLCSDGDLQEGISYEALSFASVQKLNKLVVILDSNKISVDGEVKNAFTEEIEERFESLDFNIIYVKNGFSISEISSALKSAKKADMPSVIIVNTKIGKGLANEGTNKAHSGILSNEEVINLKQKMKLPIEAFKYDENLKKSFTNNMLNRVSKKYSIWEKEYNESKKNKGLSSIINLLEKEEFFVDFDSSNYQINQKYCEEGKLSNYKVMNFIAPKTQFFIGGSADLSSSTKTIIDKSRAMSYENPTGRNIAFGVREHAMGAILNGLALSGLHVFGNTFLAFSDYLKPALRFSAMMNLPVTYIFTHDCVNVGPDGATHEPIEQLAMLRSTPNIKVFRPCDINEIIGSWEYIMKNKGTTALVISKEKMTVKEHTNGKFVQYGAYIVRKEKEKLDGVIIATGSEVEVALKISETLYEEGLDIRVVSMPCVELFEIQNPIYEEKLLPRSTKVITLEASSTYGWHRFASRKDYAIGIDQFGLSGEKDDVLKYLNFDYNSILIKVKKILTTKD